MLRLVKRYAQSRRSHKSRLMMSQEAVNQEVSLLEKLRNRAFKGRNFRLARLDQTIDQLSKCRLRVLASKHFLDAVLEPTRRLARVVKIEGTRYDLSNSQLIQQRTRPRLKSLGVKQTLSQGAKQIVKAWVGL
ncbi:MAG: hypothetical protein K8F56_19685 [Rhodocyclaceae bacterium]|nr:hypothetical protein [Rhodocyclaceae bacterium]